MAHDNPQGGGWRNIGSGQPASGARSKGGWRDIDTRGDNVKKPWSKGAKLSVVTGLLARLEE